MRKQRGGEKQAMKKAIIILTLAFVLLGAVGFGTAQVLATDEGKYPPIVQKLVERFGLNEAEVKAVFDEERTERQQQMQTRFEERLDQAVSDGKINQEQKQAILAKKAEMQENRGELKDLSFQERKQKMEEHRGEMRAWVEANGIDLNSMPMLLGWGHRGGFGRPFFGK